ncbi:MAG TPA: heavy metal translocating P-type ATPase [Gaiellaceae bacterium]|nr:heavy metal translocating P-type ATPase [Gaiellaceae bacterium]
MPRRIDLILAAVILAALGLGTGFWLAGHKDEADVVWAIATALVLVPLVLGVARSLLRGDVGVDAIALIAIVGALLLGEYLAGAIVALMLSGGNALEDYAQGRASRELRALIDRAPRIGHRREGDRIVHVPVEDLELGDVVVVRAGEIVPADGTVADTHEAVIDTSALTGEPLPVTVHPGGEVLSGTSNAGEAFDLVVTRRAAESAYAGVVRLVHEASEQRAPFVRMADRYAVVLLPVTAVAAAAAWALSGDPVRALAVFVVATPCPLILAAPIAFVAGLSRSARAGIIVKGGSAIEALGEARTALLDKTGTVTTGEPEIDRIVPLDGRSAEELLRLAASLDQHSAHVLAEALVHGAMERGLVLSAPERTSEAPGQGITGVVDGHEVAVGSSAWLEKLGCRGAVEASAALDGSPSISQARVSVAVDGELAGVIVMADHVRPEAWGLADALRESGIEHVALVSGDRAEIAEEVGRLVGADTVYAEQSPEDKLDVVRAIRAQERLRKVMMVGDGINDAPALALADVGVAMGAQGATVSSQTADVVILVDRVDRVVDAVRIGRRSLAIARQSVLAGIAMSAGAMVAAALGFLPPVAGALFHEVTDVVVILNALRALR